MKILAISITIIGLFLSSCGNTSNQKPKENIKTVSQDDHQHIDEIETIELNSGEKWKVDAHMLLHIRNMEKDIIAFSKVEEKDYKALAEKLQSNVDLLTSNCTMKGQAHDELHKWLLPFIDMVDHLSEAQSEIEAAKQYANMQSSYNLFNQYFQ
jgi:hypothetical protein